MAEKTGHGNPGHTLPDGGKMKQPELLYDPDVRQSSHAEDARTLALS